MATDLLFLEPSSLPRTTQPEHTFMKPDFTFPPKYNKNRSVVAAAPAASAEQNVETRVRMELGVPSPPSYALVREEQHGQLWGSEVAYSPRNYVRPRETGGQNRPRTVPEIERSVVRQLENKMGTMETGSVLHLETALAHTDKRSEEYITVALTPGSTTEAQAETSTSPAPKASFLSLPYEIRLEIYHLIITAHPALHSHLAPAPNCKITAPNSVPHSATGNHATGFGLPIAISNPSLTFPSILPKSCTTRGKLPTGLLTSCKQIYHEARHLPFEANAFTFVNWFWSGVYSARQFSRGALKPWQRDALRTVGLEVLARDLMSSGRGCPEWIDLCRMWKGVKELRLGIRGSLMSPSSVDENILDAAARWVREGLGAMQGLRRLEIEIEATSVERQAKVLFCEEVEAILNSECKEGLVTVRFLEAAQEEEKEKEKTAVVAEEVEVVEDTVYIASLVSAPAA